MKVFETTAAKQQMAERSWFHPMQFTSIKIPTRKGTSGDLKAHNKKQKPRLNFTMH
jgi:hypothetical protein